MPQRTLPGASWGQTEAPPSYENALTPLEFEQKTATVVEQSLQEARQLESGPSDNGKQRATAQDEFEDWDDARFEAAAAAYRARQARQQKATSSSGGGFTPTNRAQSPRDEPSSISQQASGKGHEIGAYQINPGQLPAHSKDDSVNQRSLPLRPIDLYNRPGPSSPPASVPAMEYPVDVKDPSIWMQTSSDSGHSHSGAEGPPPFTSMASPTSVVEEHAPQAYQMDESYAISVDFHSVPPPPIPRAQATSSPSPPTFYSPQRRSEIPLSTANPHPYQPPQRHSDIPSPLPSNPPRPPTFYGGRPLEPEKSTSYGDKYSRSKELYASANSRVNGPTISIDLRKLPHHDRPTSLESPEDTHSHTSFYSSSVSSYMAKRPLPQPRRTSTAHSQYDGYVQPNSAVTSSSAYSSPLYGQASYGYNTSTVPAPPAQNHYGAPAAYPAHQQAQPYMNAYQQPLPPPVQQFQTPMYHQPAQGNQNYWPPQPGHWPSANYGHP